MVIVLPNQAISLQVNGQTTNEYNFSITQQKTDFCQQVRESQLTYFQVQVTPETETNLITNGDFLTDLLFWTASGIGSWTQSGTLGAIGNGSPSIQLSQSIIWTANRTHRIDFDVTDIDSGAILGTTRPSGSLIGGVTTVNYAMGVGSYSFYLIPSAGGLQTLTFSAMFGRVAIDNLAVYLLSEPVFTLRDCDSQTPQSTVGIVQRFEDKITYSASWTGIPDGCYNLCLENAGDFDYNYASRALCLTDNADNPILDSDGDCIQWYG